jgi:hypothetical protein
MKNMNPLQLQAKKNALGSLLNAGVKPQANDLAMPTTHGIGGVTFKNPDTVGLASTGITNLDRSKIDPDYVRRNRFGIGKLFTSTPKPSMS